MKQLAVIFTLFLTFNFTTVEAQTTPCCSPEICKLICGDMTNCKPADCKPTNCKPANCTKVAAESNENKAQALTVAQKTTTDKPTAKTCTPAEIKKCCKMMEACKKGDAKAVKVDNETWEGTPKVLAAKKDEC